MENIEEGRPGEITYRKVGNYYLPNLFVTEGEDPDFDASRPIGKYGHLRKTYLQEHDEEYYAYLIISSRLMEHLEDVQKRASEMLERLIQEMLERDPAPDKATDQMGWVRHMESLHMIADDIVIRDVVYDSEWATFPPRYEEIPF